MGGDNPWDTPGRHNVEKLPLPELRHCAAPCFCRGQETCCAAAPSLRPSAVERSTSAPPGGHGRKMKDRCRAIPFHSFTSIERFEMGVKVPSFCFRKFRKKTCRRFFSSDHDVPHFFRSLRLRLFRFGCSVFRSRAFFMRDPSLKRFKFLHLNTKIHASTYSQTREKIRWKKMSSSSAKEQVFWRFAFGSLATHTGWTHSDASKRKHKQSDPNR